MASKDLALAYAALILADDGVEITGEKIQTLLEAAKIDTEPIWSVLFAKALKTKDVKEMLLNISAGGPAAPVGSTQAPTDSKDTDENEKNGNKGDKGDKKKEEEGKKEESDEDMGFGLFD